MSKVLILVIFSMLFSCSSRKKDNLIASVNGKELFLSDIIKQMPSHLEDSLYFLDKFMNDWIKKELMISHAEMNLSTDLLNIEKQIEDYRGSLLIYTYQQELLNQQFDTSISNKEIEKYYEEYKDEFIVKKNLFKGRFIVVDKTVTGIKELSSWYKSEKAEEIEFLEDFCLKFAKEYYFSDKKWQYFSYINNRLPNLIFNEDGFLSNTKNIWFEDENFRYYIYIGDYKIKGSQSPLDFEKDKIKEVILNKNKINYLKQLEDELYENALVKEKIKIY